MWVLDLFCKTKKCSECNMRKNNSTSFDTTNKEEKSEKTIDDYYLEMKIFYERFKHNSRTGLGDKYKEWEYNLLYTLSTAQYRDVMYRELAKKIKSAVKNNEFEKLRALLYQSVFLKTVFLKNVPNGLSGGCDHSGRFFEVMGYISCLGFDSVYRCFPKDIPLCTNGYPLTVINTNLLLCILYNNAEYKKYDETTVVSKAEKRILTKSDKALRGVTMCLLGILKHDVTKFNEGLPILLKNYNRIGLLNESEKALCQFAISLVVIAKKFFTEKEFHDIVFPESKNFSRQYCEYIFSKDSFEPKIFYEYPDELSPLNQLLLTPIPITKLTKEQAYRIAYEGLDENAFKTILDEDRMVMDFILEYRARKQNNTPVSIAENTR